MKVLVIVLAIVAPATAREVQAVAQLFRENSPSHEYTGSIIFSQLNPTGHVRIIGGSTTLPSGQYVLMIDDQNRRSHACYSSEILDESSGNYLLIGHMTVTKGYYAINYEASNLTLRPGQKCSILGSSIALYEAGKQRLPTALPSAGRRVAHGRVESRFRVLLYLNAQPISYNAGIIIFTENYLTGDLTINALITDLLPAKYIFAVHKIKDDTRDCNSLGPVIIPRLFEFSYPNLGLGYGTVFFKYNFDPSLLEAEDLSIAGHAIAIYKSSNFNLIMGIPTTENVVCAFV